MEYGIQHCLKGRNLMLVLMIIAILPWPGIPFRFNQSLYYLLFSILVEFSLEIVSG